MKKFLYLIFIVGLISGCASGPYVRSDVFIDTKAVKSIYIMPIVTEVTIDSDLQMSQNELQGQLNESKTKIRELLDIELMKRGYSIGGYSKEFNELDENVQDDRLVRATIQEFLHPSGSAQSDAGSQLIKTFLEQAIFSGELTITDEEGNKRKITKEDIQSTTTEVDPLISKTLAAKEVFPSKTDTVFYLYVKSYIAKRGLWSSLTENSSVTISVEMINIKEEKVIFAYRTNQSKSDLLYWKSFKESLTGVLDQIPVKF